MTYQHQPVCEKHGQKERYEYQSGRLGFFCRVCKNERRRRTRKPTKRKYTPEQLAARREQYQRNKDAILAQKAEYRERRPDVFLKSKLKHKYGITLEQYQELFTAQGGRCAICLRSPKKLRLSVDHDHKTGAIRGLLCWQCNTGLQRFRDDAERLLRAAQYLARDLSAALISPKGRRG